MDDINNEMKVFINEASFISSVTLKKVLKLICKYFYVDLPIEDFLKVDIEIMENGNVKMRGDEYQSNNKPKNYNELLDRYDKLKIEIESVLDKREISFDKKRKKNDFISFLLAVLFTIIFIIIIIYVVKQLLYGNIFGAIWLVVVLVPLITPRINEKYVGAIRFIKNLFNKK